MRPVASARLLIGRLSASFEAQVTGAFLISRAIYRGALGVELDASPVHYFLQWLDPHYLETDLARSVLSLHHQAPLLNLLLGVCLKLFGRDAYVAMDVVFLSLGLAAALSMRAILVRLGVGARLALFATCLYACSPVTVLYESWLFYPHVVASLLVIAGHALLRFVDLGTVRAGAAFFALLATVALVRSTFGPLYVGVVAIALAALRVAPARVVAKACAAPMLVLALHAAKTPLYVGHGYGDALVWPNLAKKIYIALPKEEVARLKRRRVLSPAMKHDGLSDLASMRDIRVEHAPTGIPALDDERTPSKGPNGNAIEHALIAERYYRPDALYLAKHYPGAWLSSAARALVSGVPASPTRDSSLVRSPNYRRLAPLEAPIQKLALTAESGASPLLGLLLAFGVGAGATFVIGGGAAGHGRPRRVLSSFALLTIGYVIAVTVLVSWGDFSRYRYEVDGLFWILIVLGVSAVLARACSRPERGGEGLHNGSTAPRGRDTTAS